MSNFLQMHTITTTSSIDDPIPYSDDATLPSLDVNYDLIASCSLCVDAAYRAVYGRRRSKLFV